MISIAVPGKGKLTFHYLVLDFNGTIAFDGKLIEGVKEKINTIANNIEVFVITADTNGTVHKECEDLTVTVRVIGQGNQVKEKESFVKGLPLDGTVAIGNGVNDELMFNAANLAIAVIGREGCAVTSLMKADIVANHIHDALDLLLQKNRLIATLRK